MKLIFGSDHAGFRLRHGLAEFARGHGYDVSEVGAPSEDPYDYPDAADALAPIILTGEADFGVLVCGSGVGISIRANRYRGIRAALCCDPELARLARLHNHANVLCLGERTTSLDRSIEILEAFLNTEPDNAERHVRRVEKLDRSLVP